MIRHIVVASYAGGLRISVFGLWLSLDPILLCIRCRDIGLYYFALSVVSIGYWVQGFRIAMVLQ